MKFRFLCNNRRQQLLQETAFAIHSWQDSFDTGMNLLQDRVFDEAIPHLGCAFETSEILLTSKVIEPKTAYELMAQSAAILAKAFASLAYHQQANQVISMTIDRFEHECLLQPHNAQQILSHIEGLLSGINSLDAIQSNWAKAFLH